MGCYFKKTSGIISRETETADRAAELAGEKMLPYRSKVSHSGNFVTDSFAHRNTNEQRKFRDASHFFLFWLLKTKNGCAGLSRLHCGG